MTGDIIKVRVRNKLRIFSRTEKHWFDITDSVPDSTGVLRKARLVGDKRVADLYSKSLKGRASKVSRLRKEKAVNSGDDIRRYSGGGPLI